MGCEEQGKVQDRQLDEQLLLQGVQCEEELYD